MSEHDQREDYDDEPWRKRATPERLLRIPASTIAALGIVLLGFSILVWLLTAVIIIWELIDPMDGTIDWLENIAIVSVSVVWNWVVIRGTIRMRRCRNYRLAIIAAVLSFYALPFSVWALVLLARRDVRARFAAVARGKMNAAPPEASNARTD